MKYLIPVDIGQASLPTVKAALRLAHKGDEVYLLYVQLESANTPRDKAEAELHQVFEPVLDRATGVQCYLHAICIRAWQEAGCSAEQLVARAISAKARALQATVVMAGPHRSAACLGLQSQHQTTLALLQSLLKPRQLRIVSAPRRYSMRHSRSTATWVL